MSEIKVVPLGKFYSLCVEKNAAFGEEVNIAFPHLTYFDILFLFLVAVPLAYFLNDFTGAGQGICLNFVLPSTFMVR